jgi:surfeit locus 1 family protein
MKLNIPCGLWIFSPGLVSSLFTLLLVPLFVYLGLWQCNRFEEKNHLLEKLANRLNEPVLQSRELPLNMNNPLEMENYRFRQLTVKGTFLNDKQILLDNQLYEGRVGYRVITPLLISDHKILLVDRGWIPMGNNRQELPIIPPRKGQITVVGMINQFAQGLALTPTQKPLSLASSWPRVVQLIDFKELSKVFQSEIPHFIIQVNQSNPLAFRMPAYSLGIPASRHLGYAVQWFGMAIAALIYYLVINGRRLTNVTQVNNQTQ